MQEDKLQNLIAKSHMNIENAKFAISQCNKALNSVSNLDFTNKTYKTHLNTINQNLEIIKKDIKLLEKDLSIQNKTKLGKWLASYGVEKQQQKEFDALNPLKKTAKALAKAIDKLEVKQQQVRSVSKRKLPKIKKISKKTANSQQK